MKIDFTMSGMNFLLFLGIALILQSICILILQNPIKRWKSFVTKDFILFAFELLLFIVGVGLLILGLINAIPLMI